MTSVKFGLHVAPERDDNCSPISLTSTSVVALITMGCPILVTLAKN